MSAVDNTVISLTDLSRMLLENYAFAILINSFQWQQASASDNTQDRPAMHAHVQLWRLLNSLL